MGIDYQFRWSIIIDHWHEFAMGALVDIMAAAGGFAIALGVGLFFALFQLHGNRFFKSIAFGYIQIVLGVPVYVMLLWIYFGIATMAGLRLTPIESTVAALALVGSGYVAEIIRSGISAIDRGQFEAARSIGLSSFWTYRDIILPQTLRVVVGPLGSLFIGLVKFATIMAAIAAPDMMHKAQELDARYFIPFEVYTVVLIVLSIVVMTCAAIVAWIEKAVKLP